MARLNAYRERMMAKMDSQLEETKACLEKEEATDMDAKTEE
jgi:hypothetical protein